MFKPRAPPLWPDFAFFFAELLMEKSVILGARGLFCTNTCKLGSLKNDPVKNHGVLRLRWSAYMVYKRKLAQLT